MCIQNIPSHIFQVNIKNQNQKDKSNRNISNVKKRRFAFLYLYLYNPIQSNPKRSKSQPTLYMHILTHFALPLRFHFPNYIAVDNSLRLHDFHYKRLRSRCNVLITGNVFVAFNIIVIVAQYTQFMLFRIVSFESGANLLENVAHSTQVLQEH